MGPYLDLTAVSYFFLGATGFQCNQVAARNSATGVQFQWTVPVVVVPLELGVSPVLSGLCLSCIVMDVNLDIEI